MSMDLPLQRIAREALDTFPPLGNVRDAASNYAQRMLTQLLSEMRKSGISVSDQEMQEQRQVLDNWINSLEAKPTSDSVPTSGNTEQMKGEEEQPLHLEQLEAIISACFHTATDGSPKHLAHLRRRAMREVNEYIEKVDMSWGKKRRAKGRAKQIINKHLQEIK